MRIRLILLAVFLLSISNNMLAQGNLQFNEVKFLTLTVTQTSSTSIDFTTVQLIVPAGKTWKIEDCGATDDNGGGGPGNLPGDGGILMLNESVIYHFSNNGHGHTGFPLWLPSGSYTVKLYAKDANNSTQVGNTFTAFISALEFNVVP